MYQLLHEDLARAQQRHVEQEARKSWAVHQVVRLARAERRAQRAQADIERAGRRLVALGA